MSLRMITANRLHDGEVVYLGADRSWVERFAAGVIAADDLSADALMRQAEQAVADRLVVAPYLIDVAVLDGRLSPLGVKERIRAIGPSVRPDLGKQAAAGS